MQKKFAQLVLLLLMYVSPVVAFADDPANPGIEPTPFSGTLDSGETDMQNQYDQMMEKCRVVDKDGNGLIKAYQANSGINLEGDASAWIWVPYGQCAKINAGDFNGVSPAIMAKINSSNIQQAPTLEND